MSLAVIFKASVQRIIIHMSILAKGLDQIHIFLFFFRFVLFCLFVLLNLLLSFFTALRIFNVSTITHCRLLTQTMIARFCLCRSTLWLGTLVKLFFVSLNPVFQTEGNITLENDHSLKSERFTMFYSYFCVVHLLLQTYPPLRS